MVFNASKKNKTAVDAPRVNTFLMHPEDLTIVTDKEHPLYDKRVDLPLDENMVLNIMAFGVKEAVLARKNGDAVEVVNGRQRVKHAIEANKRFAKEGKELLRVRVLMEKGSDADIFGVTCFTNEFRRDDGIMGKAEKATKLLALGKTEQEVAITFGVSKSTLNGWISLLECPAPIRKAVDAGEISPSAAIQISKLPKEDQVEKLTSLKHAAPTTGKRAGKVSASKAKAAVRGKADKPTPTQIREVALFHEEDDSVDASKALQWAVGDISAQDAGIDLATVADFIKARNEQAKSEANAAAAKKGKA